MPLFNVWDKHADGRILGLAVVLPHARRVGDIAAQRGRVDAGLRQLVVDEPHAPQRYLRIPDSGRIWLTAPDATKARLKSLLPQSYRRTARTWVSVTPVVHSRWQKGVPGALWNQVARDCSHVGLPEPEKVEKLRGPGHRGGASRILAARTLPDDWRGSLNGPAGHVRITFPAPVTGPLLLGRARHFGLGLCLPGPEPSRG
jgi:CRISPR-associated protein Csb2